ncbi:hypothetical protein C3L33_15045, partial [Rhododendron williamsianum]
MDNTTLPLHLSHVQKSSSIINRSHTLLHSTALIALIYYRIASFFQTTKPRDLPTTFSCLLVFTGELILSFLWFLGQAYRFRPVSRTVFPERLPENVELPAVDVFICTADPSKEPTLEVTTLIRMLYIYLHVYLSDDGGCSVTLEAMKEAWRFAKGYWVPYCRAYGIKTRCPGLIFLEKRVIMRVLRVVNSWLIGRKLRFDSVRIPPAAQLEEAFILSYPGRRPYRLGGGDGERERDGDDEGEREAEGERGCCGAAAGAVDDGGDGGLEAAMIEADYLRVSAMISNSPYILVLDCDMYCNDPTSARQAMCFHLDPKISPSLGFVQFPQKFHNISKTDVYDSQLRYVFKVLWQGMDGLQGPIVSGTGFYIKREALYANPIKADNSPKRASCSRPVVRLEHQSLWTQNAVNVNVQISYWMQVGFLYLSLVEDYFTGLVNLHCKGWKSVYCDPVRPAFLGAGTTNLNDVLVQSTRWISGLVDVTLSRFCPLIYGPKKMSALQTMCYGEQAFFPFYFLPLWCFATIPQLCLLNGIAVYPEVVLWQGMDGLQGPVVSGTGFYIKREALYANPIKDVDVMELKQYFGPSNEFIKSFGRHYKPKDHQHSSSVILMKETQFLASCAYENETKWAEEASPGHISPAFTNCIWWLGANISHFGLKTLRNVNVQISYWLQVGFLYLSVVEDYFTGLVNLHCKGWKSVYCDPVRPAFLGAGTTNLNDVLVQSTRWSSGLVEVALSRFCPLIYGPKKMSALQTLCYGELAFFPFYFLPLWCFATIPQLCLLNGIAVYPEVVTQEIH